MQALMFGISSQGNSAFKAKQCFHSAGTRATNESKTTSKNCFALDTNRETEVRAIRGGGRRGQRPRMNKEKLVKTLQELTWAARDGEGWKSSVAFSVKKDAIYNLRTKESIM